MKGCGGRGKKEKKSLYATSREEGRSSMCQQGKYQEKKKRRRRCSLPVVPLRQGKKGKMDGNTTSTLKRFEKRLDEDREMYQKRGKKKRRGKGKLNRPTRRQKRTPTLFSLSGGRSSIWRKEGGGKKGKLDQPAVYKKEGRKYSAGWSIYAIERIEKGREDFN